jgi:hypothetical protein
MVKGRWKSNSGAKKRFFLRALKWTRASYKRITRRADSRSPDYLSVLNAKHNIRSPGLVKEIASEAMRTAHSSKARRRINFFSMQEKQALISENNGLFWEVAKRRWGALLRKEFGNKEMLVDGMKQYMLEQLDYYDPEVRGWGGKASKPQTFIFRGCLLFCRIVAGRALRRREVTMPVDKKGRPLDGLAKVSSELRRKPTRRQLLAIPPKSKAFLKNLGVDIDEVAIEGFSSVKEGIIQIALDPSTGLAAEEREVVKERLGNRSLDEIGRRLVSQKKTGVGKERVRQIEAKAIRKILARRLDLLPES